MRLMRGLVREFNVYRWAGRMLLDAAGDAPAQALLRAAHRHAVAEPPMAPSDRTTAHRALVRPPPPPLRPTARCSSTSTARWSSSRRRPDARARRRRRCARCCRGSRSELGGAVALITGRAHRRRRPPVPGTRAADRRASTAASGATPRGALHLHAPATATLRAAARAAARASPARHPRLLLEDKGAALALHYRQAPQLAAHVHRTLRDALARAAHGLRSCSPARAWSRCGPRAATRARRSTTSWREAPFAGALPGVRRRRPDRRARLRRGRRAWAAGRSRSAPGATARPLSPAPTCAGRARAGSTRRREPRDMRPRAAETRMMRNLDLALIGNGAHRRAGRRRRRRSSGAASRASTATRCSARCSTRARRTTSAASSRSSWSTACATEQAYVAQHGDARHAPARPRRRRRRDHRLARRASVQYGRMFRPMMLVRRVRPLAGSPRIVVRLRPALATTARARPRVTVRQQPHPLRRRRRSRCA